jgi:hypothetical protein
VPYSAAAAAPQAAAPQAAAVSTAPPILVYANGVTALEDWSWGGAHNFTSTADPYPGHDFAAAVAFAGSGSTSGGLCFRSATPLALAGLTALEFDIRANASALANCFSLQASLCLCDDCSACAAQLPALALDEFAPAAAPCTVPSAWDADPAAAHLTLPLARLLAGAPAPAAAARLQFEGSGPCNFAVDNVRVT